MNPDTPSQLLDHPPPWLDSPGADDGIVVSCRVRLARNLAHWPFPPRLDKHQQQDLVTFLGDRIRSLPTWADGWHWYLLQLRKEERQLLSERRLIPQNLITSEHPAAVLVSGDEHDTALINEEDHLRLQHLRAGLDLDTCLERVAAIDRALENDCSWAVHERYGYLTTCPTNVGTGMRASVMLHLPVLAETKRIAQALRALPKLSMTVRGHFGEGSKANAHLFQVSNQCTLGQTEEEISHALHDAAGDLIRWEQLAREELLPGDHQLEDRIFRALAVLRSAVLLDGDELLRLLSLVRLGRAAGLLEDLSWAALDRAFIDGQTAHIRIRDPSGSCDDSAERDARRAQLVRSLL